MKCYSPKITHFGLIGITLLGLIICYIGFYPGAMTWDSLEQLRQARVNEYGDWQPPTMAYLWHYLLKINNGPGLMLLFHMVMLGSTSIVLYCWARQNNHKWGFLFLFIPFLPWVLNFQFVVWKDVGLAYSWALSVAVAIYFYPRRRVPVLAIVMILLLFLYGFLVRANAITGSVFLLPFLACCIYKKNSIRFFLFCVVCNLVIFATVPKGINILLGAEKTNPLSYLMFDDLVALKLKGMDVGAGIFKPEDISKLELCDHRRQNIVGAAFCISERFEEIRLNQYSELKVAWKNALSQYTKAYLSYRFEAFVHLLRLPMQAPYYPSEFRRVYTPYTFDSAVQKNSTIGESIIRYVKYSEISLAFFFKPFFWIILSIVIAIILRFTISSRSPPFWMLPLSGLTYVLGYFPATPAADFRYIYWSCLICTISFFLWISMICQKKIELRTYEIY